MAQNAGRRKYGRALKSSLQFFLRTWAQEGWYCNVNQRKNPALLRWQAKFNS
jgi:hypothetical protein